MLARMIRHAKESVAFHEASHAVANISFRIPCRVWIEFDADGDTQTKPPWKGVCRSYRIEEKLGFKVTKRMAGICGIAGAVGEFMLENHGAFYEDWPEWRESVSVTDRESINGYSMIGAAREAYPLLADKWAAVEAIAKRLVKEGELTDWQTGAIYNRALRIKGDPVCM